MHPPQRPLLALALRVVAAMLFATMLMLVKWAGESGVAVPEIMFWRQGVTVPIVVGYLWLTGGLGRLRTQRIGSHGRRALLGMTNMAMNFASTILLPLAVMTTLGFSTPLFAVVIAALVLREHVGPWRWTAVVLGLAGVVVIAQPGGGHVSSIGVALALLTAVSIAGINYQIRDLGRTEEPIRTVFWFAAFGTPMAALALPFCMTSHTPLQWLVLIGIGTLGTIAQLFLTASLRLGSVASVIVMDYTGLIWATFYEWLVWDRLPLPTTWLGAPLIIAAGLIIAWREHRLAHQPSAKSTLELD